MARISVRYLTTRPGPGGLPRYFWQPNARLRAEGWRIERVPADWHRYHDAAALATAAIARAQALNAEMDAARTARAQTTRPPAATRTVRELIADYTASKEFTKLRTSTQCGYRQCLGMIDAYAGATQVRALDPVRVRELKESLATTPSYANAVIRVLRLLLAYGRRHGWVSSNAASRRTWRGAARPA